MIHRADAWFRSPTALGLSPWLAGNLGRGIRLRYRPPNKTLYNRFISWSRMSIFNNIFAVLAAKGDKRDQLMIDVTHLKARRYPRTSDRSAPACSGRSGFRSGVPKHRELAAGRGDCTDAVERSEIDCGMFG